MHSNIALPAIWLYLILRSSPSTLILSADVVHTYYNDFQLLYSVFFSFICQHLHQYISGGRASPIDENVVLMRTRSELDLRTRHVIISMYRVARSTGLLFSVGCNYQKKIETVLAADEAGRPILRRSNSGSSCAVN